MNIFLRIILDNCSFVFKVVSMFFNKSCKFTDGTKKFLYQICVTTVSKKNV